MGEAKMKITSYDVNAYLESIENPKKKEDARKLFDIFKEVSQYTPAIWANKIIGFGNLHYRYKTGHEGDMPYSAFAIQKARITLYLWIDEDKRKPLFDKIGKYKAAKSCIYINKLDDINIDTLKEIIKLNEKGLNDSFPK